MLFFIESLLFLKYDQKLPYFYLNLSELLGSQTILFYSNQIYIPNSMNILWNIYVP